MWCFPLSSKMLTVMYDFFIHNILLDYIHSCSLMSFTASSFLGRCRLYCLPSSASQWANSLIFTSEASPSFISSTTSTSTSPPMPASLTFHMHCRSAHRKTRYQVSLPFFSRHVLMFLFMQRLLHLALFVHMWTCGFAFILIMCVILTRFFFYDSHLQHSRKVNKKKHIILFWWLVMLTAKWFYTKHCKKF